MRLLTCCCMEYCLTTKSVCEVCVRFFFIVFFFGSICLFSEEQRKMTLSAVQDAALAHSEELSIAELQTLIASEKIQEIRGINLPKLTVDGSYNLRNNDAGFVRKNPMYKKEEASSPAGPPQPKKIKTIAANKEVANGKLSLIVPVYDFGYVDSLLKAQALRIEATVYEKEKIQQNLLFAVANNFYRALEGAKIEDVVAESIKVLKAQFQTAQDLFSEGFVTQNDVLVVEVQLAEREQELIQARHNIESAIASLARLTGEKLKAVSDFQDVEEDVSWQEDMDAIMAQADAGHPALKKIQASTTAAVSDLEATKAENYPDINAFVNLNSSSDTFLLHKNWVHGGVCIQIPIFDGGIVTSKVAQKRTQISALDLQYTEALEDIHLGIQKAYLKVDSAFHQIPVAQKSISLAEDNLMISQDKFEEGLIMSDDVLNDESRLAQARSNYYQSLYDFYIAKSELDFASGRIQRQGTEHVG